MGTAWIDAAAPLRLEIAVEEWRLKEAFRITGHVFTTCRLVVVNLSDGQFTGRGEAAGIYYRGDTTDGIAATLEQHRAAVESGLTRDRLQSLMPAGGARNALDCALWDLDAQRAGRPAWSLAKLAPPRPLVTTFTVGAADAASMAKVARAYSGAVAIKIKLVGDAEDAGRVRAVRAACPHVFLAVDANQGLTPESLNALLPTLVEARVELLEQPLPADPEADALLDQSRIPIPMAADESALTRADLPRLRGRFSVVNIKLDKSGGLTEALAIASEARRLGFRVMVGNMTGTSLAMAPAFVVGQLCDVVDLDGPIFLIEDRTQAIVYRAGRIAIPEPFWGGITAE